jgi:serine/threonine-protein kinase
VSSAAEELKQLGRYDLTRILGKGAMGIVYEGLDPKLHRKVAIKTILKGHMDDDDASKEYSMRFMREAQAVARLNHPHIVQVYDFGEEKEVAYIVMEFIKGKELKNFFDAAERFELKEAVRIMCELLDALEFAHEGGIVHRDIKPANVMLDSQARVKLADFGVARVTDDRSAAEKTQAGTMVGTPAYMSPEQITGGNIDRRTDVFSAGIILYQFLTGEKPFTGSGAWTIAKKIIQDHPPVPSSINNTISPLFDAVVNKALSKSVEGRYQSAKEFGAALKRALDGRSDEDESDKTVVGSMADMGSMPKLNPQAAVAKPESTKGTSATGSQEVELEFWRAIKDGNDPDDFELYVQQFPSGIYAALAKRKIAKLRGVAPEETGAKAKAAAEQEKKEAEEAAKREAEVKQKLAEEKAKLEAQLAAKEAEYQKREAEAAARQAAEAKARAEADAKREAEAKARAIAEEKARLEAIEKAKKEAQAELAKREIEYQKREAEARAKADAETKARKETEARAKQEAEALAAKARADAEAKAKKQAEEFARARAEADARAKKDAEERTRQQAEAAKQQAEAAKREAELKKKLAEAPKAKMPVGIVAGVIIAIAAVGGGAWYYFNKANLEKQAALTEALEQATKASQELQQAQAKAQESLKVLEEARAREIAALKSGDAAKIKEAQEAAQRAQAEANKQAEAVKQREAAAADARKKAQEAAENAKKSAAAPKDQKAEVVAVAPKAAEVPKQEAVAKAEPARTETAAANLPEPPKREPKSRSEREAARDAEAAAKALAAAGKAPVQLASAAPTATGAATPGPSATASGSAAASASPAAPLSKAAEADLLYQQGLKMEGSDAKGAVRIYRRAARDGNGKAAKRLGELFDKGAPGVDRDYQEALSWYSKARELGETVELSGKR